jgi:hypothetical protein
MLQLKIHLKKLLVSLILIKQNLNFHSLLFQVSFNEAAYKKKQMMSKSSKERATGSLAGYFDNQFKLLPGSYIDPISMRRKARLEEKKKNIVNKPFITMYRPKDPYVKKNQR